MKTRRIAGRGRVRHGWLVNWIAYVAGAALALAAADVFVKLAAGRLPDSLGMLLYGTVPFVTGLIWYAVDRSRGSTPPADGAAVGFALAVGVTFTLVTFALYAAFRHGAPISLVSPAVRLGGVLVASVVGFLLWNEPFTPRFGAGLVLCGAGVYLMVGR
jgi:drug/metabolite transporter (DMT)-like permease